MGKIRNYKDLLDEKHRLKAEIKKDEQALKNLFTTVDGIMAPLNMVRKFSPFLPGFLKKPGFMIGANAAAILISRIFGKKKGEDQPGILDSISTEVFYTLGSTFSEFIFDWFGKKKDKKSDNEDDSNS
jgi:hypothetical protein